jgi:hypothetical protein
MNFSAKAVLILILVGTIYPAIAGNSTFKLGKLPKDVLMMDHIQKYPDADAVILMNIGRVSIDFNESTGWEYTYSRECRIKILNDEGYDWATMSISTIDNNNVDQKVASIKGYTYNLENGKLVKEKLSNSSVFSEKAGKNYKRTKFTMPGVKEGSVVEFSYKIISDYLIELPEWKFQSSIPTEWSELYVTIPEYFHYIKLSQGYGSFHSYEESNIMRSVTFSGTTRMDIYSGSRDTYSETENFQCDVYHWVAKDVEALKNEKFVGNVNDYRLGIEWQLSTYKKGTQFKNILGSWADVNKALLVETDDFGPNMRKRNFYKDEVNKIKSTYTKPIERLAAVYQHITEQVKWDDRVGYIPADNIKKCYEARVGAAPDINALLVSMLRAAGISAEPVILSTRSHGLVNQAYPILDKFNYLIAAAWVDGKTILMDATDRDLPPGMLPSRCLNGVGRVISETNPRWIDLQPAKGHDLICMGNLKINDSGKLCGTMQKKWTGYGAIDIIEEIKVDGEESYKENVVEDNSDWAIRKFDINRSEKNFDEVLESFEVEFSEAANQMSDLIYLNLVVSSKLDDNPFKQEKRELPVDFTYPVNSYSIINFTMPEGYVVDEMPQSINVSNPDKSIVFKFFVKQAGPNIQLVNHLQQKRSFFTAEEYEHIREVYAMVLAKHSEQIVLKRAPAN